MRIVIQRVSSAGVSADGAEIGKIGPGLCLLCGFTHGDIEPTVELMAAKCLNLRIFEDQDGKMNLSLPEVKGAVLVVSQFTLYADCKKGRRPSFTGSADPIEAEKLYQLFIKIIEKSGIEIQTGRFGAKMLVTINNDGPVTIVLDSEKL
jgi:D-aminoacyl-tRNA deacylase